MLALNPLGPLIFTAGLDLGTTEIGLHRGLYDANPIAQSRPLMYGGKIVQIYFVDKNVRKLNKTGHKRAAKVLFFGSLALEGFAVVWNVHRLK